MIWAPQMLIPSVSAARALTIRSAHSSQWVATDCTSVSVAPCALTPPGGRLRSFTASLRMTRGSSLGGATWVTALQLVDTHPCESLKAEGIELPPLKPDFELAELAQCGSGDRTKKAGSRCQGPHVSTSGSRSTNKFAWFTARPPPPPSCSSISVAKRPFQ